MNRQQVVRRPDVHLFATHVLGRLGCTQVIDVGCVQPRELAKIHPKAGVIGLGIDVDLRPARSEYRFGRWVDWDPESDVLETVSPETVARSVVVSTIESEHPTTPRLIEGLKQLLEYAPAALVTTMAGSSVDRFRSLLESAGFCVDFVGLTAGDNVDFHKDTPLAVLGNNYRGPLREAPVDYRVVALINSYNEEDIIVPSIAGLIEQGVEIYLMDDWSTDRTVERAEQFLGRGVITIERFPPEGPSDTFHYGRQLRRKVEISTKLEADWFIHMDVDEIRHSPWPGKTLKDALYHVDSQGFNAVDHTVLIFKPTDNGYVDGSNFEQYFRYFHIVFSGQDSQIKAWKNTGKPVALDSAGHRVAFVGRRIYPYNFVYKHYPIRSQQHGEAKIAERKTRLDQQEVSAGWHGHVQRFRPDHNFLVDESEMLSFDEGFHQQFLVERLGVIGPKQRAAWAARRPEHPQWRKLAGRVRRGLRRRFRESLRKR